MKKVKNNHNRVQNSIKVKQYLCLYTHAGKVKIRDLKDLDSNKKSTL